MCDLCFADSDELFNFVLWYKDILYYKKMAIRLKVGMLIIYIVHLTVNGYYLSKNPAALAANAAFQCTTSLLDSLGNPAK